MSHDAIARTFDEWVEKGRDAGMEKGHRDVVEQVIERMHFRPGEKILELGCGNGWATRLLARKVPGAQAVGVDVAPRMIARAEELHSFTIRARYEVSPFEDLDLPDGDFDRVFSMEALYYAVDLEAALSEAFRVLKPGGEIDVVIDYYTESEGTIHWPETTGVAMLRLGEAAWIAAFERAGFAELHIERIVDSRGPGDEASFEPSVGYKTWAEKRSVHEAGSLWIHGARPA